MDSDFMRRIVEQVGLLSRNHPLYTDEHGGYRGLGEFFYTRERIYHGAGECVRAGETTTRIESFLGTLKRGLHAIYHHHANKKHVHRYVDEFTLRLNDEHVKWHIMERMASLGSAVFGPRITYREWTP